MEIQKRAWPIARMHCMDIRHYAHFCISMVVFLKTTRELCKQALDDMLQPDFRVVQHYVTVWGTKN